MTFFFDRPNLSRHTGGSSEQQAGPDAQGHVPQAGEQHHRQERRPVVQVSRHSQGVATTGA